MIYSFTSASLLVFFKLFFKLKIKGRDSIPAKGPFLLAVNHVSNLDPLVVGGSCRRPLHYLAKKELFINPLMDIWMRMHNCTPLNRQGSGAGALKQALKVLKVHPLLIFPQGTRTQDMDSFKSGVGFLAKKANVPVVAARIYGTDKILPKGAKYPQKGKIKIVFGRVDTIAPEDDFEQIAAKIIAKIKSL
jgi:1-acyl-sn-glycerol-3-phosphate acyltransferase